MDEGASVPGIEAAGRKVTFANESSAELLVAARATYAGCTSYVDHGTQIVEFVQPDGVTSSQEFFFATVFSRSASVLRFEWGERNEVSERGREVVLRSQGRVQSWPLGADQPWTCTSLAAALAEDAGGAAPLVASLLLPAEFDAEPRFGEATAGASVPERVVLDGVVCWRIELERSDAKQQAWLAVDSLVLRRLVERRELGGVVITTTTRCDARFDVAPTTESLTIAPPTEQRALRGIAAQSGVLAGVALVVAVVALVASLLLQRRRRA